MAAPAKTVATSLLTLQTIATAVSVAGTVIDVSTKFAGCAYVHFGRTVTTALTAPCSFRIDASSKASLDAQWYPLYQWYSDVTVAVVPTATAGSAGAASITLTNTGFVVGDRLFCKNGTLGNSEFVRVNTLVSTTGVTLEDNLVNAQTTSVCANKAEWWAIPLDFAGVGRIRLVVSAATGPTGVTVVAEGWLTTLDTIA